MDVTEVKAPVQNTIAIASIALHQVDVETNTFSIIPISKDYSDLNSYLVELLSEVDESDRRREYGFSSETTELYTTLLKYQDESTLIGDGISDILAKRLLKEEVKADKRYGHLGNNKKGHVKKGSFLQFLYTIGTGMYYLGVKMEHQVFIDESDFKKKAGLSVANKIYKACKISFGESGVLKEVHVYDTNSTPAKYWWNEFLDLTEIRNDNYNTRTAAEEVMKVVGRLKNDHPIDHTILRNSVIGAFKQDAEMDYIEFVDTVIRTYTPEDEGLIDKLPSIIERLEKLPAEKKFDTKFKLIPGEVPFRKTQFKLSKEMTLYINDSVDNIEDKVWAEETSSGKKLVVIESPEGFKNFKIKERIK
jgi:hypothetical protein